MPFNLPVSIPDSGYKIARSLRFNSPDSTHLIRTFVTPTNRNQWTFSAWFKRGKLGVAQSLFGVGANDQLSITATDIMYMTVGGSSYATPGVYRDPSAWMHVVWRFNGGVNTLVSVNNVDVIGVATTVNTCAVNTAIAHYIGWGANLYDGYMADVHFIDGQSLPPSSFGQTDPTTGVWMPKAYTGLYGANGFKLDFADNSAVTAATLGKDRSGMSNLLTYSDAISTLPWSVSPTAVVTAGQSDPLGGTGAVKLTSNTLPTAPYVVYTSQAWTAGLTYTFSIYLKYAGLTQIQLNVGNINGVLLNVDLVGGTILSASAQGTGTLLGSSIQNVGGGWYKCSVTLLRNTTAAPGDHIWLAPAAPALITDGVLIFRADLTLGATVPAELQYTAGAAVPDKNWTPNAFSVTAGVGNDSLVDTPTNYGIDAGLGGEVRGNYCTFNSVDKTPDTGLTLANGNLQADGANSAAWGMSRGTLWVNSGKWYYEVAATIGAPGAVHVGIVGALQDPSAANPFVGFTADGYGYSSGAVKYNSGSSAAYGATYVTGDIIGVAFDLGTGALTFYKNGVSQGVAYTVALGVTYAPAVSCLKSTGSSRAEVNFGQRPFAFAAPAGFKALCTQNLPDPAIKRGDDYFITNLRTGTAAVFNVTGKRFQPDLIWIKNRVSTTLWHYITDSVRNTTNYMFSNTTNADIVISDAVTALNSDGFTGGAQAGTNTAANGYVDWLWKKGVVPGVDIVTYTGTGVARTIAHSLGVAPRMMIVKARSAATPWLVYRAELGPTIQLQLQDNIAAQGAGDIWNTTNPTAAVFSLGTNTAANANGVTYVAYLFTDVSGFSKCGSYNSNAAVDGPFVWCGFKPSWMLVKNTTAVASWSIYDTVRGVINPTGPSLYANFPDAEVNTPRIDFLSNGFKLRTSGDPNVGAPNTHIYVAFAENPFKYARAR